MGIPSDSNWSDFALDEPLDWDRQIRLRLFSRCQRLAERLEQRAVDRVAVRIIFGVPLHAERKARRVRDADRLDGTVFCHAFDHDALARLQDALAMQRVD